MPSPSRGDGATAQLVGHHLQPRQRAHAGEISAIVGDRLGQKIVGAGLEARSAVSTAGRAR